MAIAYNRFEKKVNSRIMIIISANRRNLDYAPQAPLHPGYTGFSNLE